MLPFLALTSCSGEKKGKPNGKGPMSEVVLVADSKGELEKAIKMELTVDAPGLLQSEPCFDVLSIVPSMDKGNPCLAHSRVIVHVDKSMEKALIEKSRNVNAHNQLQYQISGPSNSAVIELFKKNAESIREDLLENQIINQAEFLKTNYSSLLAKDLKEVLGYVVYAPQVLQSTKKGKSFVWSSSGDNQMNMVFYAKPFSGEDVKDEKVLIAIRDSVMKENLPGGKEGQWMETTWTDNRPMVNKKICKMNGREVTMLQGMWQMRNDDMGGPFVSISFVDSAGKQIVTAEGFVFAPNAPKRDLLRRLEAALHTFKEL